MTKFLERETNFLHNLCLIIAVYQEIRYSANSLIAAKYAKSETADNSIEYISHMDVLFRNQIT